MLMSKKLKTGQPGTGRLITQHGARLVCVSYRYDAEQRKRLKTIELRNVSYSGKPSVSVIRK